MHDGCRTKRQTRYKLDEKKGIKKTKEKEEKEEKKRKLFQSRKDRKVPRNERFVICILNELKNRNVELHRSFNFSFCSPTDDPF